MKLSNKFLHKVSISHINLGIPASYSNDFGLPLCEEPGSLVDTELDFYQRPQKLTPAAFQAWTRLRIAANSAGVSLFLISAFRSIEYQHELIDKKLVEGQAIEDILKVNAAPGYSEHHTGRAIDVGTIGCDALVEEFEDTKAFQWLNINAQEFGFIQSYPKNNSSGIDYEPWHWCFQVES
ncbi:MAG: M15 family metallopeptidase [Gammaproteobacteria bacterium]|nr:M15 family metallopeptidase [Gammaproteobacteria bacterium]